MVHRGCRTLVSLIFALLAGCEGGQDGADLSFPEAEVDVPAVDAAEVESEAVASRDPEIVDSVELPPRTRWAGGLRLIEVSANQGVESRLATPEGVVAEDEREVVTLSDRATLVAARAVPSPGIRARVVEAQLSWIDERGVLHTLLDAREVEPGIEVEFSWELHPNWVRSGSRFRVVLLEADGGSTVGALEEPVLPASADAVVNFAPAPEPLRVTLVPYRNRSATCSRSPELDEDALEGLRRTLKMLFPVRDVHLQVHAPLVWEGRVEHLGDVLEDLREVRLEESPAPDVFYFGLVLPCDPVSGTGMGFVPSAPSHPLASEFRVSVGVFRPDDLRSSFETVAHELGHNLGRKHVSCRGDESEPDAEYPHPDGFTHHRGFGIEDGELREPGRPEIMSYCAGEAWVSDYGWNATYEVLRDMSSAHAEAQSGPLVNAIAMP